jgi:hypothetical protein
MIKIKINFQQINVFFCIFIVIKFLNFRKDMPTNLCEKNNKKLDCKKTESFYATEKTMLTHPKTSLGLDLP